MGNITFLGEYSFRQIIVIDKETDLNSFINQNNLKNYFVVCENEKLCIGDYILIKKINKSFHVVKPGETLKSIATFYNKDEDYLKQKNKTSRLFVGQLLKL